MFLVMRSSFPGILYLTIDNFFSYFSFDIGWTSSWMGRMMIRIKYAK